MMVGHFFLSRFLPFFFFLLLRLPTALGYEIEGELYLVHWLSGTATSRYFQSYPSLASLFRRVLPSRGIVWYMRNQCRALASFPFVSNSGSIARVFGPEKVRGVFCLLSEGWFSGSPFLKAGVSS